MRIPESSRSNLSLKKKSEKTFSVKYFKRLNRRNSRINSVVVFPTVYKWSLNQFPEPN